MGKRRSPLKEEKKKLKSKGDGTSSKKQSHSSNIQNPIEVSGSSKLLKATVSSSKKQSLPPKAQKSSVNSESSNLQQDSVDHGAQVPPKDLDSAHIQLPSTCPSKLASAIDDFKQPSDVVGKEVVDLAKVHNSAKYADFNCNVEDDDDLDALADVAADSPNDMAILSKVAAEVASFDTAVNAMMEDTAACSCENNLDPVKNVMLQNSNDASSHGHILKSQAFHAASKNKSPIKDKAINAESPKNPVLDDLLNLGFKVEELNMSKELNSPKGTDSSSNLEEILGSNSSLKGKSVIPTKPAATLGARDKQVDNGTQKVCPPHTADTVAPSKSSANPNKSYASLFNKPRKFATMKKITTPGESLDFKTSHLKPAEETWGRCLVGCFTGRFPGLHLIDALVKDWGISVKVIPHTKGWIILKFQKEEDLNSILTGGPYQIGKVSLILNKPESDFAFIKKEAFKVPVWVKIYDIPPQLWHEEAFSMIASRLGNPLYMDDTTATGERFCYARFRVLIDATAVPLHDINCTLPSGKAFKLPVEYESYPCFCCFCQKFGHTAWQCFLDKDGNSTPIMVRRVPQKSAPPSKKAHPSLLPIKKDTKGSQHPPNHVTVGGQSAASPTEPHENSAKDEVFDICLTSQEINKGVNDDNSLENCTLESDDEENLLNEPQHLEDDAWETVGSKKNKIPKPKKLETKKKSGGGAGTSNTCA